MPIKELLSQWENDATSIARYYNEKNNKYGSTPKGLGEREEIKDKKFFDQLFEGLEMGKQLSVMDIGSGLGDLIPYLENNQHLKITDYLGLDLLANFVDYCKIKYPNREFVVANFISEKFQPAKKYDLVVAMGVLISRATNYNDYLAYMIQKALKYTNKFFVFNLITNIDKSSPNYKHQKEIGGITCVPENELIGILDKLNADNTFTYNINKKKIYTDAIDAFVQIKIK